jgi:hypothetical protein
VAYFEGWRKHKFRIAIFRPGLKAGIFYMRDKHVTVGIMHLMERYYSMSWASQEKTRE